MNSFQENLERIAENSLYAKGANVDTIKYSFEIFRRFLKDKSILEMGPAEGIMTDLLAQLNLELTCVDGSQRFCADLSRRHPNIEVVNSLFEEFRPDRKYDNIVLGHVLEHVEDPIEVLALVAGWLEPGGIVLSAVPNALSLHRQAAVLKGLLETEKSMSELDRHHGHYREIDPYEFRNCFKAAGFKVITHGGYWLKPVSNRQVEETWTSEMLEAFMRLGERYPDIAGEQYVIATR